MNESDTDIVIVCDLAQELPLMPDELALVQGLLPELLKDMMGSEEEKE